MNINCCKIPVSGDISVLHKGTEKFNVIFQNYPTTYTLSNSRLIKYIEPVHLPKLSNKAKSLIESGQYIWKRHNTRKGKPECLFNVTTQEWVARNPKTAGTPRIIPISGQDFWSSGEQQQWNRIKLKEQLMEYFIPRIRTQLPESIWMPVGMYMHIEYLFFRPLLEHDIVVDKKIQDLDNHAFPYMKIFKDTLQYLEIIKNDDPRYIRGMYPHYVHIDNEEERRLEVKIHFCHNDQTAQRPIWVKNTEQKELDDAY